MSCVALCRPQVSFSTDARIVFDQLNAFGWNATNLNVTYINSWTLPLLNPEIYEAYPRLHLDPGSHSRIPGWQIGVIVGCVLGGVCLVAVVAALLLRAHHERAELPYRTGEKSV